MNVAVGYNAMDSSGTAGWNTVVGQNAGSGMTSANHNVVIGNNSGVSNNSSATVSGQATLGGGKWNVFIGSKSGGSAAGGINEIAIGYEAVAQGNNTATIGNEAVTKVYMAEDGAAVIYANGTINTSDLRLKDFIKPVNLGLQFINKLNPVSYLKMSKSAFKSGNEDDNYRYEYGLIAQEVDEILKESDPENSIISKDNEGFLGMDYKQLIMPLIESVQELSAEIDRLRAEIKELKK